jgi:AcrR family transcriptional regulator
MDVTSSYPTPTDTRQRLLEAAGEVFAERGFRTATVREICQRAQANIAAVNYYFGDKERLYAAVLHYAHRCFTEKYPPDLGLSDTATAEQRLHAFIRSFLWRIFGEGQPSWHGKLMLREMVEPTQALDALVEEEIRPLAEQLETSVRELLGHPGSHDQVRLCAMSIASQCVFYHHCQPVLVRLYPAQHYRTQDIERLADHITHFSLGALRHLASSAEENRSAIATPL